MKILIGPNMQKKMTYDNLLYETGLSSIENAILEVSSRLVKMGHHVTLMIDNEESYDPISGLHFIYNDVEPETYDIYCPICWFDGIHNYIIERLNPYAIVIVWFHSNVDSWVFQYLSNLNKIGRKLLFCTLSTHQIRYIKDKGLDHIPISIVPNAINQNIFCRERPLQSKTGNFVFHAPFDHGGLLSIDVFNAVKKNGYKFRIAGYNDPPTKIKNDDIEIFGNLNKLHLIELLDSSDYFVYGLVLPEGVSVQHDMYGPSILEALACGVIVITWDIPSLRDIYGDMIILVPPPEYKGYDSSDPFGSANPKMSDPTPFINVINQLENNLTYKEGLRERGKQWALQKSWDTTAIKMNELLHIYIHYHLKELSDNESLYDKHIKYLLQLKYDGFEPKVIYDIGSYVLHWTNIVKIIWPDATIILFDAFSPLEFLYGEYNYHIGLLGDEDDKIVQFLQPSLYTNIELKTRKLDTIIKERNFPIADFVNINVQGTEIDILKGGLDTFKHAKRMIVNLKNEATVLNIESFGWKCTDPLFNNNKENGDYGFVNLV